MEGGRHSRGLTFDECPLGTRSHSGLRIPCHFREEDARDSVCMQWGEGLFPSPCLPTSFTIHTEEESVLTEATSELWMDHVSQNGTGALGKETENDNTGQECLSSDKKILERG